MITIDDGKHFLVLKFDEQQIIGEVLCEAGEESRCREEGGGECVIQRGWENVGMDMLAPTKDDSLRPKFPIRWRIENENSPTGEWEDWIEVIGPAHSQRKLFSSE